MQQTSERPAAAAGGESARHRFDRMDRLSERERQVLEQLATGATNHAIARTLHVTEGTVKAHVGRILMKLDLESRTAAAVAGFAFLHRCPACRASEAAG
ncbi:helix-turn-helix transcriptional regulator [Kitasatospora cinereorecta]|uniref:Response regulator transcription factor n=1 Tax=Kitasatospora cinereorecta TaxID=285560 RepID=A0ABW0VQL4_9ACTN